MSIFSLTMTQIGVCALAEAIEKGLYFATGIKKNHAEKWMMHIAACGAAFLCAKGFLLSTAPHFFHQASIIRCSKSLRYFALSALLIRLLFDKVIRQKQVTSLERAIESEQVDLVRELIDKGFDLKVFNEKRRTPLHFASQTGNRDLVQLLIDNGADVNAKDQVGQTPLHDAARRPLEVVQVLIERGADMRAQNASHETPLECAIKAGRLETVAYIAHHRINQNAQLQKLLELANRSEGAPLEQETEGNETEADREDFTAHPLEDEK